MSEAIFIQHIQGYGGTDQYKRNEPKMKRAGFVRLRSEKDGEGKYWEIWYLPGTWHAEGPIKGKSFTEIKEWVFHEISPGEVTTEGKHYGLCVD